MTRAQSPTPTRDLDRAKRDMDAHGYALLRDALTPDHVQALRDRLIEQADCEITAGVASLAGGEVQADRRAWTHQRVRMILNKGKVFQQLLDLPGVHEVIGHAFANSFDRSTAELLGLEQPFLLSSLTGEIKRRSRDAPTVQQTLHVDQPFIPGGLAFPLVLNVFYMLSDFTDANGATRFVPATHREPPPTLGAPPPVESIPAEGPPGTALIFEGRTWHCAGAQAADDLRVHIGAFYCAPYMRPHEILPLSLTDAVVGELSERQRKLCGFDSMYQGQMADVGFGLMESTLGRSNPSIKFPPIGELHR